MRSGPADLQFASDTLVAIATGAKRVASALEPTLASVKPMGAMVTTLIGGTATGVDAELKTAVLSAEDSLKKAQWALQLAAQHASQAAASSATASKRSAQGR
ncbi:MAG: hypothetical protein KF761_13975 [Salinibacterium sp.]|nr:hypothetical protein [Salinibacterium sp.]